LSKIMETWINKVKYHFVLIEKENIRKSDTTWSLYLIEKFYIWGNKEQFDVFRKQYSDLVLWKVVYSQMPQPLILFLGVRIYT
jgi:hypothetical protein